jgi:hypothetical protein
MLSKKLAGKVIKIICLLDDNIAITEHDIAYMPTKLCCDPPRPWPDTIAFDAPISIGRIVKFIWWIHAPAFTVRHWHYHLGTSLC